MDTEHVQEIIRDTGKAISKGVYRNPRSVQGIADLIAELVGEVLAEEFEDLPDDPLAQQIAKHLEHRDTVLMARDGSCRDTLEGCEKALREVYLIATTGSPDEPF